MSYDIKLKDPVTNQTICFDNPHDIRGGTYQVGGCVEAWLNITYNYSECFHKALGENGIRTIYGMSGAESIPVLVNAIDLLGNDKTEDYWEPTEGNAKSALFNLLAFARMRPDGIWWGD